MDYKENVLYICEKNNTTMTNKEWKIKNLRQSWSDLLLEKESLIKKIWDVEYKIDLIKEKLLHYGVHQKHQGMGGGETDMGESDSLDNCFACSNSIDIHEL